MPDYLILKLHGPMQAWGKHTFEDYRPSEAYPTLSGLLGLLAACLGITRRDLARQQQLAGSVSLAVRIDERDWPVTRLTDFHTVMDARRVSGKAGEYPVVSRREYLCDAVFSVALGVRPDSAFTLDELQAAVCAPLFTPWLGRKSCPLARPLFETRLAAESPLAALQQVAPHRGVVYLDAPADNGLAQQVRDVPLHTPQRQFGSRTVHRVVSP
jgi:CRISPR system Cascade subunit CasD